MCFYLPLKINFATVIQKILRNKLQCNTNLFKPISFNNEQQTTACKPT